MVSLTVPFIINGAEVIPSINQPAPLFDPNPDNSNNHGISAVGATPELCVQAVESCAHTFITWKESQPSERRRLFNKFAQVSSWHC